MTWGDAIDTKAGCTKTQMKFSNELRNEYIRLCEKIIINEPILLKELVIVTFYYINLILHIFLY